MWVDYTVVNAITCGDGYSLPNIAETLDTGMLNGSVYFTTLDLYSGYHQVNIDPKDTEKTTFQHLMDN